MAALYTDPAYHYPVYENLAQHVDREFWGEPMDSQTFAKVREYLEQLVPGSTWRVYRGTWLGQVELMVRFDTEQDATMYMLRWS